MATDVTTGKMAAIVSPSQIAINVGSKAGVQMGDEVVMSRLVEIRDPDTKEVLGAVKLPKLSLKVNLVSELYSVAVVTDRVRRKGSQQSVAFRSIAPLKTVTEAVVAEEDGDEVVRVRIGETVQVRREESKGEPPPF